MPSFLVGKSRGAFGQPAFFLAGKRGVLKALIACLPKRMFDSTEVLNLRKNILTSTNGKKKFKRILSCLFGGR